MTISDIVKYFQAEKNESLIFVLIGVIAIVVSCYGLFVMRTDFFKGLAYPLLAVALIQLVVGGSVYLRSPGDIERVSKQLQEEPTKIKTEELPRMEVVNKNFVIYRYVEIALAVIGILLCVFLRGNPFWFGIGTGLTIQALLMLGADYFAEQRALHYTELIQSFISNS